MYINQRKKLYIFSDQSKYMCAYTLYANCVSYSCLYHVETELRQSTMKHKHRISAIMASLLTLSVVDHGFKPRSGQAKDYKIGVCCFSAKHAALKRKSKYWLAQNQNNVSEWSCMSNCGLLFQCASTIKMQLGR